MALRSPTSPFSGKDYFDALRAATDEVRREALFRSLQDISARELYEAGGFMSGLNTELVDGHIRFALRKYEAEPKTPLRLYTRDCLLDGWVVFERFVEGDPLTPVDPHTISQCKFDYDGRLVEVKLKYIYDGDEAGNPWPRTNVTGKPKQWTYCATVWIQKPQPGTDGDEAYYRAEIRYPAGDEGAGSRSPKVERLDFFPYEGVAWDGGRSLYYPVRVTILRYEACMHNLASENNRHARRAMVFKGVEEVQKSPEEFAEEGQIKIPRDADVFYPDTHASGIQPMFDELTLLEERIRSTLGLVKVADLHNASGSSRMIEIMPNISTAEAVRETAEAIMALLYDTYTLNFPPIAEYTPQELTQLDMLYRGLRGDAAISPEEYKSRMRYLNNFRSDTGVNAT